MSIFFFVCLNFFFASSSFSLLKGYSTAQLILLYTKTGLSWSWALLWTLPSSELDLLGFENDVILDNNRVSSLEFLSFLQLNLLKLRPNLAFNFGVCRCVCMSVRNPSLSALGRF